jgi:hypothetical protein
MREPLITFETAKLAKEKGFDIVTGGNCWVKTLEGKIIHNSERHPINDDRVDAKYYLAQPTQSLLQQWLWETYKIWVEITLWGDGVGFTCMIKYIKGVDDNGTDSVYGESVTTDSNPYTLLEKGLQEALKLIKL